MVYCFDWLGNVQTSSVELAVGVCIGPGSDRPGPKTEMGEGCGPRTGPDRTDQVPAFYLAANRVVARSARTT